MQGFLLDTQPFIMLASIDTYKQIGRKARRVLEDENAMLMLSSISLFEIAIKVRSKKLVFPQTVINALIERLGIGVLDFNRAAADQLCKLPKVHNDLFNRMLISFALSTAMPILSSDRVFREYKGLAVIWQ